MAAYEILEATLGAMVSGPRPLGKTLHAISELHDVSPVVGVSGVESALINADPGDPLATIFRRKLAAWDNAPAHDWTAKTTANTSERRLRIYELLQIDGSFKALCEKQFTPYSIDPPTIIATDHVPWYNEMRRSANDFYWRAYLRHLEEEGWRQESILQLDASTTNVVERIADPTSSEAYKSKGLVVGYVQSGKTANFVGVIAKAADAGYRLIIILAGLYDVLRSQTQRRVDKDLIGQELLQGDYVDDLAWNRFLRHGARPSELGAFDWYRLTGPEGDYRRLAHGIDAMRFERTNGSRPFYDPTNLAFAPARIAIVKKHSIVLSRLLDDLRLLRDNKIGVPLDQIPALVIDDESDQASINVNRTSTGKKTPTNAAIVEILKVLPRVQYIGYTATPFANVFVDPDDADGIFPQDFIVALPRPAEYMGVSDFHDLDASEDDPPERRLNESAYVRRVVGSDEQPENVAAALDAYVLSGAIKLFREAAGAGRFRHHTMLVHSSVGQDDHKRLAELIRARYATAGYDAGAGMGRLQSMFENDYRRISRIVDSEQPFPTTFEDLIEYVGSCISKIGMPADAIRIVNDQNRDNAPNFDKEEVWKIIVGGAKLSRGYTVEGLTISYYRRRAKTADTLMQMGRWFGFRKNYKDLVRLYIGREEPIDKKGNTIDLYSAFEAVCRDEEMFRDELRRYATIKPRILPRDVPPLVPSHMLMPTAKNKMYNTEISHRNFGGGLSESTFAPPEKKYIAQNVALTEQLFSTSVFEKHDFQADMGGTRVRMSAWTCWTNPKDIIKLLEEYCWFDPVKHKGKGNPMREQIEFLRGTGTRDPMIARWLVIAPQIKNGRGQQPLSDRPFTAVYRTRRDEHRERFGTYNDPKHRQFARHLACQIRLEAPNDELVTLTSERQGVLLLYFVTDDQTSDVVQAPFSPGFTLLFPLNTIASPITFIVKRKDLKDAIVNVS